MSRHSAGCRTGAGSDALPIMSLYAAAASGAKLREIGIFNTTTTPVALRLVRLTATGTPGADLTEGEQDEDGGAPDCTAVGTHSVGPTLGADLGYRATLGAAIGAGVIWTFGESGLRIKPGTGNGIGVIPISGATGQVCDVYFVWDE